MGSGEGILCWSMFDNVKNISTTPEAVMTEINSTIPANEYARATPFLRIKQFLVSKCLEIIQNFNFGLEQFVVSKV